MARINMLCDPQIVVFPHDIATFSAPKRKESERDQKLLPVPDQQEQQSNLPYAQNSPELQLNDIVLEQPS